MNCINRRKTNSNIVSLLKTEGIITIVSIFKMGNLKNHPIISDLHFKSTIFDSLNTYTYIIFYNFLVRAAPLNYTNWFHALNTIFFDKIINVLLIFYNKTVVFDAATIHQLRCTYLCNATTVQTILACSISFDIFSFFALLSSCL